MGDRRRAREHVLQMLYQSDIANIGAAETLKTHWERDPESEASVRAFAERLVSAVLARRDEIDELLVATSHNWPLSRMGVVDRNLLRLAVGEFLTEPSTPPAVVIDEAVEIARDFGERDSQAFVNGILEAVRRRLSAESPKP